ncbi:hypothetical protein N7535_006822 [Penicillium sp. DV-2018c]|nr:hypothetical protein N7535_006822 [Penicillium sp. DV-2018c]
MARLNTANPLVNNTPHKEPEATRSLPRDSGIYHGSSRESTSTFRNTTKHKQPKKPQSPTQRQSKSSSGSFEIFSDNDLELDSGARQPRSTGKQQKQRTLGLARVNSLLLPSKRRPPPAIRRETEDYDKENDVPEHVSDGHRTQESTPTRPTASRTPARNRMDHVARRAVIAHQQEVEEDDHEALSFEEGDSSDSLDGFIVSDNEDPSFYETSDSETFEVEEEPSPAPSPARSPRKRLMRGRRPAPEPEPEPETEREQVHLSDDEPSIEQTKLHVELDQYTETTTADDPEPEESITHLDYTPLCDETSTPAPSAGLAYSPYVNKHRPDDLIKHLEDLGLDSDDDFTSPEPEFEPSIPSHLTRTKPSPVTPLRKKLHGSSPTTETPTTVKAQKKAEAARKRELRAQIASFNENKVAFAENFLQHLESLFDNQITRITEGTGGIQLIWTKNFRNTAGRATVRSERIFTGASGIEDRGRRVHHATIELSEKVLDSEDKILCTLTHEYCHLLDMLVTGNRGKGASQHGASFKQWGARCVQALDDHPVYGGRVAVTTKHTYEINHKYVWACEAEFCDFKVGRHSKSVDPTRQFCGRCRGTLRQIKPVPRGLGRAVVLV